MFGFEIPFGFALLLIVIYLVDKLLTKIVDGIEHTHQINKDLRGRRVYEAYRQIEKIKPEDRESFLSNQPRSFRKLYEKGVSYWGEPN